MDTEQRENSQREVPKKKWEKLAAHIKQIILPSTVVEFTWLAIDDFMEENGLAPLSQKGNKDPLMKMVSKKFKIFSGPSYKNSANSHPKSQFDLSSVLKNGSAPPLFPLPRGEEGRHCELCYHPHPTHHPLLHHHVDNIYFQRSTTTI